MSIDREATAVLRQVERATGARESEPSAVLACLIEALARAEAAEGAGDRMTLRSAIHDAQSWAEMLSDLPTGREAGAQVVVYLPHNFRGPIPEGAPTEAEVLAQHGIDDPAADITTLARRSLGVGEFSPPEPAIEHPPGGKPTQHETSDRGP
jgi:hypothetical protein